MIELHEIYPEGLVGIGANSDRLAKSGWAVRAVPSHGPSAEADTKLWLSRPVKGKFGSHNLDELATFLDIDGGDPLTGRLADGFNMSRYDLSEIDFPPRAGLDDTQVPEPMLLFGFAGHYNHQTERVLNRLDTIFDPNFPGSQYVNREGWLGRTMAHLAML